MLICTADEMIDKLTPYQEAGIDRVNTQHEFWRQSQRYYGINSALCREGDTSFFIRQISMFSFFNFEFCYQQMPG